MVRINGQDYDINGKNLSDFLIESGYDIKKIAVEKNGEIVKRASYKDTFLSDGDKIEIVKFVGGG